MRHAWPLLRKNLWLKKRHPVAAFFEVLCPVLALIVFAWQKTNEKSPINEFAPGWRNQSLFSSFTSESRVHSAEPSLYLWAQSMASPDYLYSDRPCLTNRALGLPLTPECATIIAQQPKLAIVPDNAFTREYFGATLRAWYPSFNVSLNTTKGPTTFVVPSVADDLVFFASEAALEAYVTAPTYGPPRSDDGYFQYTPYGAPQEPRKPFNASLRAAIVFNTMPSEAQLGTATDVEYTLRFPRDEGWDSDRDVRSTARGYDPVKVEFEPDALHEYTTQGFFTLNTLVTRVLSCRPAWDPKAKTTNGTCTTATTAVVDGRLRDYASADLRSIIERLPVGTYGLFGNGRVNATLRDVSPEVAAALLRPLQQAPQPFLGAASDAFPIQGYGYNRFAGNVGMATTAMSTGTVLF
ncbi:ATP-binding Cassette (ABC) Superfamily, partial [Achlya hypogyna]